MADTGPPPEIPSDLQQYNSYVVDPTYQIKFTIVWTSVLAFALLAALPRVLREHKRWRKGTGGVLEDSHGRYMLLNSVGDDGQGGFDEKEAGKPHCVRRSTLPSHQETRSTFKVLASRIFATAGAAFYWAPPFVGGLNVAQIILIAGYLATAIICSVTAVPLTINSNRAGFMALAQLPPLFLLSAKSSPLSLLLLPPQFSYTKLNFLHRWSARGLIICVTIHGAFWIADHLRYGSPIIGEEKETTGIAAFGVLCCIALASLKIVREKAWAVFHWVHFLGFPAFFVTICYHTPYASPWIFAPIAIYTFDLFMRSVRVRGKDGFLIKVDNQMTIINIPDCDTGFHAGQHLRVRVFFEGRGVFEAHPLSIMSAPSGTSILQARDVYAYWRLGAQTQAQEDADAEIEILTKDEKKKPKSTQNQNQNQNQTDPREELPAGILLGARVSGDWTAALNKYAGAQEDHIRASLASSSSSSGSSSSFGALSGKVVPVPVQIMFDGPYGGCSIDVTSYERVLLLAGGSGATFAIGMLDEIVGSVLRRPEGVKTRRVDFVWCMRSFGGIKWFAPILAAIAHAAARSRGCIRVRILVYVTCLCSPEDVPEIPGMEVRVGGRPDVKGLLREVMGLDTAGDGMNKGGEVDEGEYCDCGCAAAALEDQASQKQKEKERDTEKGVKSVKAGFEGRVAVCASGPVSMTRDAANAVAKCKAAGWGGAEVEVGLHTEVFAI